MSKLKKLIQIACILFICFAFSACTHSVHVVNFSEDIPIAKKKNARAVESKGSQFVILGFASETNYVNQAYNSLLNTCPSGQIAGIATKFYTSHGFFSWTNYVVMSGYCYN